MRARHHEIAAQNEIGVAGRHADGVDILGAPRQLDVAEHRAALLREARHVDHAAALAFEMRGHADDRADRHHAGAADPGDDDRIGTIADLAPNRLGGGRRDFRSGDALSRLGAMHRDEGRAEPVDAGKVLVAARLVDDPLAAEFGLQRLHRDAIGFDAAIAAAFADQFVDDDSFVGIGIVAALAAAALFGGAGLVVDQHGRAGNLAELLLDDDEIIARAQRHAGRPIARRRILGRIVGDHDDAPGAVGGDLPGDLRDVEAAFVALPARHRHRVVE